ncbi:MAG: hypothetical protein ACJ79O_12825 [Myxococcales bacterium]
MRTLVPSILACLALAAFGSGCGNPERAPLEVGWNFGGLDCDQVGVETIHVEIDRELLNPSDFACFDRSGGVTTGAALGVFLIGNYRITVIGFDAQGNELAQGTQDFHIARGNNLVEVPVAAAAELNFSFAGGMTCSEAQVDEVQVRVDGVDAGTVPCSSGGIDGALVYPLEPGTHVFDILAIRGTNQLVYATSRPVSGRFTLGVDTTIPVDADPVGAHPAGDANLTWDFGSPGAVCTGGTWSLTDPFGNPVGGGATCPGTGISLIGLTPPGLWTFTGDAFVGGAHFSSNVLFGVPNGGTGDYIIPFTRVP